MPAYSSSDFVFEVLKTSGFVTNRYKRPDEYLSNSTLVFGDSL